MLTLFDLPLRVVILMWFIRHSRIKKQSVCSITVMDADSWYAQMDAILNNLYKLSAIETDNIMLKYAAKQVEEYVSRERKHIEFLKSLNIVAVGRI